ncbi:hypothetical protein [Streptomyces tsukubensis]|uniref:hypothetical protein n=1 Tax=Streptomyces tsukubensis TaxID=83656 RepID=UPI00344F2F6F
MSMIYLISAAPGDVVPGHELADPHCPDIPGLLDRPEVRAFFAQVGYGPDEENELVYLLREEDPGLIPARAEYLTITV